MPARKTFGANIMTWLKALLWSQVVWVQIPALPLTPSLNFSKLLDFLGLQFVFLCC